MVEGQRITDPSQLSDIATRLSSLSIGPSSSSTQKITLVLLQPLADPDMLAACGGSDIHSDQLPDDPRHSAPEKFLDIRPLSKAWRQAVMKVPPITDLEFDFTLPQIGEGTGTSQKLYWEVTLPRTGGLAVTLKEVIHIATTIATEMRMRTSGELRFGVTYDLSDRPSLRGMALLEKALLSLAEFKRPVKDEERNEQDSAE
ncbi:hypothetical protein F5884DRAFT_802451 [Xylogone sp. PMI_703]|nr:hypothetical protein F5884DRAFT_802451 [Xylogone sp. PMI_703]